MRLSKLVLHNYRKFEDYTIPLHPKCNVLIGNNNAGKSTILDAASIALGTFLLALAPNEAVSIGKDDPKVNYYHIGSVDDLQQQFPVSISADGCIIDKKVTWCRDLIYLNGETTTASARNLIDVATEIASKVSEGDTDTILPLVSYYGTGRLWAPNKEKEEPESIMRFVRQSGYIDCLSAASDEKLMFKWFEKMTLQEYQLKLVIPELKAVKQAISKCLAKISGVDGVEIQFDILSHMLHFSIQNGDKVEEIPMSYMGDGYRCILGMIGDIACRMAILNPQLLDNVLQTPGVVLIDDIELHLHPGEQQKIVELLQDLFPNVQFVLSTHSPMVIGSVRRENVVQLSPGTTSTVPLIDVYGHDANTVLSAIQDTPDRIPEVQELYDTFYQLLDHGDVEGAEKQIAVIEALVGPDDPNLIRAHVTLEFEVM